MKNTELFDSLGQAEDRYVIECAPDRPFRRAKILRVVFIAAAVALLASALTLTVFANKTQPEDQTPAAPVGESESASAGETDLTAASAQTPETAPVVEPTLTPEQTPTVKPTPTEQPTPSVVSTVPTTPEPTPEPTPIGDSSLVSFVPSTDTGGYAFNHTYGPNDVIYDPFAIIKIVEITDERITTNVSEPYLRVKYEAVYASGGDVNPVNAAMYPEYYNTVAGYVIGKRGEKQEKHMHPLQDDFVLETPLYFSEECLKTLSAGDLIFCSPKLKINVTAAENGDRTVTTELFVARSSCSKAIDEKTEISEPGKYEETFGGACGKVLRTYKLCLDSYYFLIEDGYPFQPEEKELLDRIPRFSEEGYATVDEIIEVLDWFLECNNFCSNDPDYYYKGWLYNASDFYAWLLDDDFIQEIL